ncbi:MAG: ArsA family ATPase [Acidobacteria bacterium]|nr:ArsA family ATPase [Acidobacteriota bacterium]
MSELYFFIGKGGVGKTTLSAAFAVERARQNRVLLISTDPAHSLGDILETKLGDKPARVPLGTQGSLLACEVNPAKRFRGFLGRYRQELVTLVERASLFTADEISALLETTLPGMAEVAGLLAIEQALEDRSDSIVVVDTAPFGHTLRLFDLPRQFLRLLRFLDLCAQRDRVLAEHFGGHARTGRAAFLDRWRAQLGRADRLFVSAHLVLVTTGEAFALNESVRCLEELGRMNPAFRLESVILNRTVVHPGGCDHCQSTARRGVAARHLLRKQFRSARLYVAEDPGAPIVGTKQLAKFAAHVFRGKPLNWRVAEPLGSAGLAFRRASWPKLIAPLSLVVGKGGVGKTTISAALGYRTRRSTKAQVIICSVDPAPSLDDIFKTSVGNEPREVLGDPGFLASEFDSIALYRTWMSELKAQVEAASASEYAGLHVDLSYDRRIFLELLEMVPPGIDELLAIFRIMELDAGAGRKVVIDMAPTAHALELLRMPGRILTWARLLLKSLAAHRKLALAGEVAAKIADFEVRARELSRAMRSPQRLATYVALLAEPLPDRETERLLSELGKLGLQVNTIYVNRVFLREHLDGCSRCLRATRWQQQTLAKLKERFSGGTIFVVPDFRLEPQGARGLSKLTNTLWQMK